VGILSLCAEGGLFSVPGYPSVRVVVDYGVTPNTRCFVLSSGAPALVLGEGPVEAARYRNEKAGYEAYVIRQYLEPQLVQDTAIDKICT